MKDMQTVFVKNLEIHQETFSNLTELTACVTDAASLMIEALRHGGRLFFCGNGGSAADA